MASARDVAAALRSRFAQDPGVTKIHKLLYYCQGWHLVWTDQPLFPESLEAWEMGPVVATLWREERHGPIQDPHPLDEFATRTVDYVVARYGRLWGSQLIGKTHQETPYREVTQGVNAELPHSSLKSFFAQDPAADQAWYWDSAWLEGQREALEDLRDGRSSSDLSPETFIASLRALRADV